jgi:hypothetical protein
MCTTHLLAQLLADAPHGSGRLADLGEHVHGLHGRGGRLGALLQALDQFVGLLQVLQHRHGGGHGVQEFGLLRHVEVAGQELAQAVEREQGLGGRVGDRLAARAGAAVDATAERHGRLDAGRAQPLAHFAVQAPQVHAQQPRRGGDQRLARLGLGHVVLQGELQRAHVDVGPHGVQAGLDRAPSQHGADERVQGGQRVVDGQRHFLLRAGDLDALVQLLVREQLQVLEAKDFGGRLVLAAALVHQAREFLLEGGRHFGGVGLQRHDGVAHVAGLERGHAPGAGGQGAGFQALQQLRHEGRGLLQHGRQAVAQRGLMLRGIVRHTEAELHRLGHVVR